MLPVEIPAMRKRNWEPMRSQMRSLCFLPSARGMERSRFDKMERFPLANWRKGEPLMSISAKTDTAGSMLLKDPCGFLKRRFVKATESESSVQIESKSAESKMLNS